MDLTEKQLAEIKDVFSQITKANMAVHSMYFGPASLPKSYKQYAADPEHEMRETFAACDLDGDGFLNAAELHYMMESVGEMLTDEEVGEMLRDADFDGDGLLSYEEFKDMMQ